jgi:hypothetical protein
MCRKMRDTAGETMNSRRERSSFFYSSPSAKLKTMGQNLPVVAISLDRQNAYEAVLGLCLNVLSTNEGRSVSQ